MGQGADEPNQTETIEKQNSRLAASTATDEKSNGFDDEKERGSGFTKRTRSSTLAGGDGEGKQAGRNRSGTLAGGEGHDHDEAFPKEERDQMEELLHELTGQLGEP
jgi:phospholipase D1/2